MMRSRARLSVTAVLLAVVSCSGSASSDACPGGGVRKASDGGGISAETREDAVERWFEREGLPVTSEDIAAAVVAAEPGAEPGTEVLIVGSVPEVTITLEPLDPGWGVSSATWCRPVY